MMTVMGQMGQQQDFARGLQMLQAAAEHADENAPQGAYVCLSVLYLHLLTALGSWHASGSKITAGNNS